MSLTLRQIAQLVEGELIGDGDLTISGAATLAIARAGEITLANDPQLLAALSDSAASAAIVSADVQPPSLPHVVVADVHGAFSRVVCALRPRRPLERIGVSPAAHIAASAQIADDVDIHPGAVVANDVQIESGVTIHSGVQVMAGCRIGADSTIFPNVVLYEETRIGCRVNVHSGAVIGAYGFGYQCVEGRHQLSAQLGWVEIHDDVDIGAGVTIDRGTYDATIIGEGTKIDNMVMIAHNCRIGRHNLLCSQVGIAGSTTTGDYVVMAGQVGVRDHVHIGDQVVVGAQAGVKDSLPVGGRYLGTPAIAERKQAVLWAAIAKLPELRKQVKSLTRRLDQATSEARRDAA